LANITKEKEKLVKLNEDLQFQIQFLENNYNLAKKDIEATRKEAEDVTDCSILTIFSIFCWSLLIVCLFNVISLIFIY